MFKRKSTVLFVTATLAITTSSLLTLKAQPPGRELTDSDARIAVARKKMHTAAEQLVKIHKHAYQAGETRIHELLTAQRQFLELELKLAKTPADRMSVLSRHLQLAKDVEKTATARFKSVEAPQSDVLQTRIVRLEIDVMILEESE